MRAKVASKDEPTAGKPPLVHGEIIFDPGPPLFINGAIYVRLEDTSLADAPSKIILEHRIKNMPTQVIQEGKVSFALYGEIQDERATYTVSVLVDVDGDGKASPDDFMTMESYPVLTFGYPDHVTVRVRQIT